MKPSDLKRLPPAATDAEAVALADKLARTLAMRNGMVSGYLTLNAGAGNPAYFWEVVYQQDGYEADGWAKTGGALTAHGPTLAAAVNGLVAMIPGEEAGPKPFDGTYPNPPERAAVLSREGKAGGE